MIYLTSSRLQESQHGCGRNGIDQQDQQSLLASKPAICQYEQIKMLTEKGYILQHYVSFHQLKTSKNMRCSAASMAERNICLYLTRPTVQNSKSMVT